MHRKSDLFETYQIILAVLITGCAIVLLFKAAELTVLYPITFGLSCILCILYAVDRLVIRRGTERKISAGFAFAIGAIALALLTYASLKVVLF